MNINADEVREVRERLGIGIIEAKRLLTGRALRAALESAQTVDDLKPILAKLIDAKFPDFEKSRFG